MHTLSTNQKILSLILFEKEILYFYGYMSCSNFSVKASLCTLNYIELGVGLITEHLLTTKYNFTKFPLYPKQHYFNEID